MDVQSALFYAFSAVLLFAAFRVITARNPVHAALYLVLAFFQASGVWMLLKAEFLSIALVLVYVGAVMVLFLFVVMMLDINIDSIRQGFWKHFPLAATVGAVIALELAAVLLGGFRVSEPRVSALPSVVTPVVVTAPADTASAALAAASQAADVGHVVVAQVSNTKALGVLLYTEYLYPVQVAAIILLVALIAAIALTLRARKDTKTQDPSQQVRVKARDRVSLVKMAAVQPAAEPAPEQEKQA
ncbi:NADH:ubiquinone oxidoreductase subunit J [Limnohabitans sp. JirII-29]|uniref:NADH-quinone oxidoreductase subunit J n=1 Tax=Limnohabitans sp. JirII-29 TaxID=1835756 RepID=UPI000D3B4DEE|nr:NADH-quinone oxidoreductase subunit J [Limnohabitans sp. JirII-29]PUE30091.1 NADH:ubiquinone oxidoreductase subunit J [Limnohabitans sp. JirII-29]